MLFGRVEGESLKGRGVFFFSADRTRAMMCILIRLSDHPFIEIFDHITLKGTCKAAVVSSKRLL